MNVSTETDVIITRDLTLGYNHRALINNITLQIHAGEFIGILGPNGSGKSTFLRALLGLLKPLAGEILVLGTHPRRGHINVGYMPQMRNQNFVAQLTSRSLLEAVFDGTHYGLPLLSETKKNRIQNVLEIVEAVSVADRPLYELSGGERQRIFLAQALLGNPRILLLDEPLANLDPRYQETFIKLLQHIQKNFRVTILFTAHDPNPLLKVMNRILYFAKGKAVIGKVNDIITTETLSTLYETHIEVIRLNERLFVLGESGMNGEDSHHHG